jgi:predicted acylesterase/phospholipase RssA
MKISFRSFALLLCCMVLGACAAIPQHFGVPEKKLDQVKIDGFPESIRFWADEAPANYSAMLMQRSETYVTTHADYFKTHGTYPALHYLAISGGAYDGAFSAGLLSGWSQSGTRPDFTLVTGVSTGALIAPFVYIGSKYDAKLKELYTNTTTKNILITSVWDVLDGITGGLSLVDSSPLEHSINTNITPQVMAEIATENRKGKRLYIATTNIEAQRGVIWDIGEIASSGHPHALELIHKIMLASASIPGVFRPVFIDVTAGGTHYTEMHVDGGVTSQVFAYPLKQSKTAVEAVTRYHIPRNLYIIRNSKITPEYSMLDPWALTLSHRSLETLIKNQGIGDLYRLYVATQRDHISYHLATIPSDFKEDAQELFDQHYMTTLFNVGYQIGRNPIPWATTPPGVAYADTPTVAINNP